jgi:AAA family ATP:ADP antiporter
VTPPERARSPLERFLGLFTEMHAGEGPAALLLSLNLFLILVAYYLLKPVREALILAGGGAEVKSYAAAGQAILLLLAVPAYGWLAARVPRRRLINVVTLFFAACLVAFYLLAQAKVPLGIVFFLWVGVFNLMIPTQLWAFANDVYTPEAGKRIFVLVAFGASVGAVTGSWIASRLIAPFGVYQLMLVAAGLLVVSLALTNVVDARQGRAASSGTAGEGGGEALPAGSAFACVLRSRYLILIGLLALVLNWVNTTGEYLLGRIALESAEKMAGTAAAGGLDTEQLVGQFYATFFTAVNLAGLLLQLFVVSRVLKYLGVGVAVLVLPLLALGGYAVAAAVPVLAVVRWTKTAENATDYSLQSTVRQVLFLPTTREEKYKAKQVTDTICVRAGDVLSAVLVFAGTTWLGFAVRDFALANVLLACVWLGIAVAIGREHARRMAPAGR